MDKNIMAIMNVNENEIRVMRINDEDYISLTDLARYKNPNDPSDVIKKWLSNYDTIEFLGLWEELSNENFNSAEFSLIKNEAPKRSFTMTPSQWCTRVNAIGMTYSKGKYSVGTFAHSDIALEFASWIDNLFKIYLIKEFKRLKYNESYQEKIEWSVRRSLSKTNYRIHTDSIKENIVPKLTEKQKQFVYANEADVINVRFLKPLDEKIIKKSIEKTKNVITIEDGTKINGLGTAIEELIVENNLQDIKFEKQAWPDEFLKQGTEWRKDG